MAVEVAKQEIERQKIEFCPKCQQRMEMQTIAVMCKVLAIKFGFGKKRLAELIEGAEGLGTLLHDADFDYNKCVDWLRDEIGIDLETGV